MRANAVWQKRFAADRNIVGRSIALNGSHAGLIWNPGSRAGKRGKSRPMRMRVAQGFLGKFLAEKI